MKLKFEKSAKGAIAIDDVPPNGQFLMLANNGGQVCVLINVSNPFPKRIESCPCEYQTKK